MQFFLFQYYAFDGIRISVVEFPEEGKFSLNTHPAEHCLFGTKAQQKCTTDMNHICNYS